MIQKNSSKLIIFLAVIFGGAILFWVMLSLAGHNLSLRPNATPTPTTIPTPIIFPTPIPTATPTPTFTPVIERCWTGDLVVKLPELGEPLLFVGEGQICGKGLRFGDIFVGPDYSTIITELHMEIDQWKACAKDRKLCEDWQLREMAK